MGRRRSGLERALLGRMPLTRPEGCRPGPQLSPRAGLPGRTTPVPRLGDASLVFEMSTAQGCTEYYPEVLLPEPLSQELKGLQLLVTGTMCQED